MSSAAQVLRQAEILKATVSESGKTIAELWVTRQRLEDLYKRLLLMDLEYALDKKVEQDLWNHAFKNQITTLQTQAKDKHNPKKAEVQANLNLFLETASGFYLQFLQLICSTFKLDLPFRRKSAAFGVMKEKCQMRAKITPPKKSSCLYICQYCLVHLGDIARYRQQVEQAQTFYRHAVNLSPQNGQPYNQLAILEVNRNNKLSSVFYYVRSLAVRHPFPVAATNLEKFYSKLIKDTSEFKGKMAQNEFVNAFLQFQALIHLSADFNRASYLCSRILACLPAHLMSQTFSASVLVQCVAITIFTLNHVRHVPSGGDANANFTNVTSKSAGTSGDGSGNVILVNESVPKPTNQTEVLLSEDEEKSIEILLRFTASVLELLVQHTPRVPARARESPTLPPIQVLLQWLCHSADIITTPTFCSSSLWGHLSKTLNIIQQVEDNKPKPNLAKYEEVPLPEDTELRCFQPIEKAHSKYSFSRVPVDGFPRGVEELVRCQRLVAQGKSISEDFPELKMTATQQGDPPAVHFSAPLPFKGDENTPPPQDRRAKQNVAMQTIMKHGQTDSVEMTKGNEKDMTSVSSLNQTSPKYLLGTIMSEPQFMKHAASSGSLSNAGGGGGSSGRLQSPPSPAQSSSSSPHAVQSSQIRGTSPFHGQSPRVASPMQSIGSSLPPSPPQQAIQMSMSQAAQQKQVQHSKQQLQQVILSAPPQHQQQTPFGPQGTYNISLPQPVSVRPSHPVPPANVPAPGSSAAHPFQGHMPNNLSFANHAGGMPSQFQSHMLTSAQGQMPTHAAQGQVQGHSGQNHAGQGQLQGHSGTSHGQVQSHAYLGKGQSLTLSQGYLMEGQTTKAGLSPAHLNQFQHFQMYPGTGNEHFRMPSGPQPDPSRMPQFPPGHTMAGTAGSVTGGSGMSQTTAVAQSTHQNAPQLPLNPEMLSALRLASQISHHQQQPLGHPQQMKKAGPLPHQQQQQPQQHHQQQPSPSMNRPPMQRAPAIGQSPVVGPGPGSAPALGLFPGNLQQRPFPIPTSPGLAFSQAMRDPLQTSSLRQPTPHLQPAMTLGGQRGPDIGVAQTTRMPPPIPMPGQHALAGGTGFSSLSQQLYKDEGNMQRADSGRAFQTLSPLTIQPPKACPLDTRISTSFQGHAEGTPKPDKTETYAPDKREHEPVICRVEMPVAQPSGEYSLFASSSPWSMSLSSGGDSKSVSGSSQFSSQESSLRNSPVVSFDSPTGPQYDALRYRGHVPEAWMLQGAGYEEPKSRMQPPTNSLWSEPSSMSPLERLLEQQRLQRQTDPH